MTDENKLSGSGSLSTRKMIFMLIAAFAFGIVAKWIVTSRDSGQPVHTEHTRQEKQIWTCSMHPQIKLPEPGLCPICNMDLIPLTMDDTPAGVNINQLTVSESAKKLMDIEVAPVERKFVDAEVRMTGKVDFDETNLSYITARIPGRLDRLYVDYTGIPVNKGDHMVYLYSPELISAQEELLQAIEAVKNIQKTELDVMRQMSESTVKSVREKLRLWGLTAEQIADIEKTGKVADHTTIYSPTSGIVIHKNALEGMYVETGTKIYTIADLSKVWIKLDAYESDLQWLRYGQSVEFTTISYPGLTFKGTISFIDPILDDRTRTIKIRVNVQNPDGKLKPGMFVKAIVRSQVASSGQVMDADLASKWICPMHPEIIKEISGQCDICQMPLVQTEDLGYVSADPAQIEKPLVIPITAALVTGTRAVVYVQIPHTEKPTFEGREVALGPRAGDHYLVRSGLSEGELVVVKGNFKIDSSLQLMAKPSMMFAKLSRINDTFRQQLSKLFESYFAMQQALTDDKLQLAIQAAKKTSDALNAVDMKLLADDAHDEWMELSAELGSTLSKASKSKDIKLMRENFHLLSQQLIKTAKHFGSTEQHDFYIHYCPMAFDNKGAHWLQDNDRTLNPYFGHSMLRCGKVEEMIGAKRIWEKKDK